MFDHISFSVNDYEESKKFYDNTLAILGIECVMKFEEEDSKVAGYGINGKPSFWIGVDRNSTDPGLIGKAKGFHIAFLAPSIESIDAWHAKCIDFGGKDNGKPGPRPEYHPGYYAGFIIDPNGWRIEAVRQDYQP